MPWEHLQMESNTESGAGYEIGEQPQHRPQAKRDQVLMRWLGDGLRGGSVVVIEVTAEKLKTVCVSHLACLQELSSQYANDPSALALSRVLRCQLRTLNAVLDARVSAARELELEVLKPGPTKAIKRAQILAEVGENARLAKLFSSYVRVCEGLLDGDQGAFRVEEAASWADAIKHLGRLKDDFARGASKVNELREILGVLEERLLLEETERTNRLLTRLSIAFLPSALLSGLFGMNVKLPFDDTGLTRWWPFWLVVGLMAVASFGLHWVLGRNGHEAD